MNNIRILFQKLHIYNKPALVNIEPDFWQYAHRLVKNNDGNTLRVNVKINPDCSNFKNTLSGMSRCIIHMARLYSPKTLIGFPQAVWDYDEIAI